MNITVFGAAAPRPGELDYETARQLGEALAKDGHTVLTGGYSGTMEAVSLGAATAGGHVIGVTCEEVENWRPLGANPWVIEEWRCPTLQERLDRLITGCDAAMALPGGVGTLTEISLFWNRLVIASLPPRPLILIGEGWQKVIGVLFETQGKYIRDSDRLWLHFAADVPSAIHLLANHQGK